MTTTADKIAGLLRPMAPERKFLQPEVDRINAIAASWDARRAPGPAARPAWTVAGMSRLGEREIVGPKHNDWIAKGWGLLDSKLGLAHRYNDDETPWCGWFIAWCLDQANLPFPRNYPAAASFRAYGVQCRPQVGALGIITRPGGNHVFQIVGETPDKTRYKGLGGNQSNAVTIMDILKANVKAADIRWPADVPQMNFPLPVMAAGTVLRDMA